MPLGRVVVGREDDEHGDAGAAEEDGAGEPFRGGRRGGGGDGAGDLEEADARTEKVVRLDGDGVEGVGVCVEGVGGEGLGGQGAVEGLEPGL